MKESVQGPIERTKAITQSDNLYPEGEFYDRKVEAAPLKGEKYPASKPVDNLKPEGR